MRRTREKKEEGRGSKKTFKQAERRKMNGTPWALVITAGQKGDMAHKGATSFLSPSSLHLLFPSQLPRRACPQTYFPPTGSGVMGQALQKEQHSNLMQREDKAQQVEEAGWSLSFKRTYCDGYRLAQKTQQRDLHEGKFSGQRSHY